MREILFRAKNMDHKWVKGSYLHVNGYHEIVYQDACFNVVLVKAESVSQFTGMFDRNGEEIYEGDILSASYTETDGREVEYRQKVMWETDFANLVDGWAVQDADGNSDSLCSNSAAEMKVIGNIWDTPELLRVEQEGVG